MMRRGWGVALMSGLWVREGGTLVVGERRCRRWCGRDTAASGVKICHPWSTSKPPFSSVTWC